jgi:hypothetical protein
MSTWAKIDNDRYISRVIEVEESIETPADWLLSNFGDGPWVDISSSRISPSFTQKAGVYDSVNNVVFSANVYPSWILDQDTLTWNPPVEEPQDENDYEWDEETTSWRQTNQ